MTPRFRRIVVLVAAVVMMGVTARMGLWQLDRAARKLALQQAIDERGRAAAIPPQALATQAEQALEQHHRRIVIEGVWDSAHTVFLDNRQMGGRPGFFVLTPLRLAGGDAVAVQRGWVPRDMQDRTRLPSLSTAEGMVRLEARIAPWPSRLADLGMDATGPIRQNLDAQAWQQETGLTLRPLSLVELPTALNRDDGLRRDWPAPAVDVHKHYGYAAQWFTFCVMIAGLYVWFQILRPRRAHAGQ